MIIYRSGLPRAKTLSVLLSILKTANSYPGSLANKKVKKFLNTILEEYPDPLYKKDGITIIKNNGNIYMFKIKGRKN